MAKQRPPLAIVYDFDGTLAPGNMQEHSFIPQVGMSKDDFWAEVGQLEQEHDADNILMYMHLMLEKAGTAHVPVRKDDFISRGAKLKLFPGVKDWFDRISSFGDASGVDVQHYVVSSGIREIIRGSPLAKHFKAIFASAFMYDHNGVACWPALAINYTTKTQYLFRINKGSLKVFDHTTINQYVAKADRPVPFENMVYIGDGETDVPCFRLVKDQGGHSIVVFDPKKEKDGAKEKADALVSVGRVNFVAPADFRVKKPLDRIVKGLVDRVAFEHELKLLGKRD